MRHKGYNIVKVKHPTTFNPKREAYDIMDGDKLRKANIANIETAKKVVDTMVKYGQWPDRSKPDETE